MSAALSRENDSKQLELTGVDQKQEPVGQVKRWAAMLSQITPPFILPRFLSGLAAKDEPATTWRLDGGSIKTVIAILTGLVGLYAAFMALPTGPVLAVSAGKDLTVLYRPQNKLVKVVFTIQAEEFGSKPNQILAAKAWVEEPSVSKRLLQITQPEFEMNQVSDLKPIIAGSTPKNMQCSIWIRLDEGSREAFQNGGLRRLLVEFKDKAGAYHQVTFCFNIGDDQLLASEEKQFRYISEDVMCSE